MSNSRKNMALGVFLLGAGHHAAAWRHQEANARGNIDFRQLVQLAQTAERGKLDMVFIADALAVGRSLSSIEHNVGGALEPFSLLSALAAVTEQIGLVATSSTTYNEPFHTARKLATLDHISDGRSGWNIVTTGTEAEAHNFGRETNLAHELRYERAGEFVKVVKELWDSWEDTALLADKASGIYADLDKVREIDYKSDWFTVKGPLDVPRPPQGYPVLIQAGSSPAGQAFAASIAEVVFTAQQTIEEAKHFYQSVKGQLASFGRAEHGLLIMPGISPILGATEQEAREKQQELDALVLPHVAVAQLSGLLNFNLASYDLDGPLPSIPLPEASTSGVISRIKMLVSLAEKEELTIRQLSQRVIGARGHKTFVGTAVQLADLMEEWFRQGACDGFNLMPPLLPSGLDEFVDEVVPELQKRGLFRTQYSGTTLRDHLGLSSPYPAYRT
ncbi:LLM class flavin-dependent oxidoreductase [Paenibacillus radicis (ex Gao et al. 2016)]|uniref:Monooxygenase n=1 Tax=Paenibacillus radicis (ex Gao et al. 2016) TaxID=1737354 RepID=A0A917LY23_9BACL|nr:LLM class flavin-dependent oxidoreductase [Paenibacillus radicis (ex Gao et al. 2016)]GGG65339.1 monooxygenase [Paenibacillus radicis (ex Gao et al. 2016)]